MFKLFQNQNHIFMKQTRNKPSRVLNSVKESLLTTPEGLSDLNLSVRKIAKKYGVSTGTAFTAKKIVSEITGHYKN